MSKHVAAADAEASRRLFLGIEMPESVQASLVAIRPDLPGAQWQWPADLHLTLRFLGAVPDGLGARISEAVQGIDVPQFELQLAGVGHFGYRVLRAGVASDAELQAFRHRLDNRLAPLGFGPDQADFVPHVTLARTRRSPRLALEQFLAEHRHLRLPGWRITHLSLFSSEPVSSGPVYRVVERFALAEALA